MAGVPNTNTFSLQDVVDVVNPSPTNSLQECFNDAVAYYFHPNYEGSKDRLSNFRSYGTEVPKTFNFDTGNDGYIDKSGSSWSTVRSATSGDNLYTASQYEVYSDYDGVSTYEIARTFLSFDLSNIAYGSTCDKAVLGFRTTTEYSGFDDDILAVIGSQGSTIEVGDYDAYTNSDIALGVFENDDNSIWESNLGFTRQIRAQNSTELAKIQAKFGDTLDLALLSALYDQPNTTPDDKYGVQIFRSGELYAAPILYIEFTI